MENSLFEKKYREFKEKLLLESAKKKRKSPIESNDIDEDGEGASAPMGGEGAPAGDIGGGDAPLVDIGGDAPAQDAAPDMPKPQPPPPPPPPPHHPPYRAGIGWGVLAPMMRWPFAVRTLTTPATKKKRKKKKKTSKK